jgi:DNA-binding IclR family transcriptional regulator
MGINAVAMALRSGDGTAIGAIAISAREQRVPPDRLAELVSVLRDTARDIRRRVP